MLEVLSHHNADCTYCHGMRLHDHRVEITLCAENVAHPDENRIPYRLHHGQYADAHVAVYTMAIMADRSIKYKCTKREEKIFYQ